MHFVVKTKKQVQPNYDTRFALQPPRDPRNAHSRAAPRLVYGSTSRPTTILQTLECTLICCHCPIPGHGKVKNHRWTCQRSLHHTLKPSGSNVGGLRSGHFLQTMLFEIIWPALIQKMSPTIAPALFSRPHSIIQLTHFMERLQSQQLTQMRENLDHVCLRIRRWRGINSGRVLQVV